MHFTQCLLKVHIKLGKKTDKVYCLLKRLFVDLDTFYAIFTQFGGKMKTENVIIFIYIYVFYIYELFTEKNIFSYSAFDLVF